MGTKLRGAGGSFLVILRRKESRRQGLSRVFTPAESSPLPATVFVPLEFRQLKPLDSPLVASELTVPSLTVQRDASRKEREEAAHLTAWAKVGRP